MLSKLMNSNYEQNGEILILYNTTREQDKEQGDELRGNFNASNQIYNRARGIGENERSFASNEQEHTQQIEHSLTKCQYCQTIFPYSLIELHTQTCNGNVVNPARNVENLKKCQFCRSIFPDSLLEQHTQTCNRRKVHQCSECHKVFQIRSKLLIHQQSHSDERSHSCKICEKTFKFKSGLTRHMRQQHSGEETTECGTLSAELQGKEYSSLQDSVNHQTGSHNEMVMGDNTGDKYKENNLVKQHSDVAKTELQPSRQRLENSSYSLEEVDFQKEKENDHYESSVKEDEHCDSEETNISEEFRKDTFEIEEKDNGMEREGNIRKFNFEFIPKPVGIFRECVSNVLPSSITQSYADSKVYKCPHCPKIFEKPSRLIIHSRTHSDEKLFTCEICQQAFKYKGSLNRHVKEQHYGQGRKSCSMVVDGRQRKDLENCSTVGTINVGNDDLYLRNIESNDGVFRHWKERHYGQGRNSSSMVVDERQRNEIENNSPLEKVNFKNDDSCLVNLNKSLEDEDGVGGYSKREDIGQGRKSLSKVVVDAACCPSEKIKFQHDDKNLVNRNETLEYKETNYGRENLNEGQNYNERQGGKTFAPRDESSFENEENDAGSQEHLKEEQNNLRMVFDGSLGYGKSLSSDEEKSFENVNNRDDQNARDSETYKYGGNNCKVQEDVEQDKNNLTMIFDERQEDGKSLSSQDEINSENVDNTNEQNARDETFMYGEHNFEENSLELEKHNLSMVFNQRQGDEKSLSSQDESSFQNVDNSTESHMREAECCKNREGDSEVQESLKRVESTFERDGRNLKEDSFEFCEDHFEDGENIFEVKSKPSEAPDECFTNATPSVNTQRCREDKVYQCDECQKYMKRSAWWNHKLTHNDEMSFTCEFCSKYFKYKGSLSRHVKEQHYGLGRKNSKMTPDASLGNNISCSTQGTDNLQVESFGPIMKSVDYEESNSNERSINQSMVLDKRPGNNNSCSSKGRYSLQIGGNNYGAILNEGDNRDSNFEERSFDPSMIFDKRLGGNNSYSSITKDNNLGSAANGERIEQSNYKVKEERLDTKRGDFDGGQSKDATKLMEGNLYMQDGDNLNQNKSSLGQSLQETQQEERALDTRKYKFFVCEDNLESLPAEITCAMCGKCFKYRGSLTRHVKEQHYGLGRKSLRMPLDENQGKVNCFSSREEDSSRNRVDSFGAIEYKDGTYKERNVIPSMKFAVSQGSDSSSSSLVKLGHQNRISNFGKIENEVAYKDSEFKEETFAMEQSNFEMKESDANERSEIDNWNKESSFENILEEVDEEEITLDSQQENCNDEQTNNPTMVKERSLFVQEKDNLNKNGVGFEQVSQEIDQKEETLNSKQDDFDTHDDNLENSCLEFTCDICGKYFKHKASLSRHVKEQHYGLRRKSSRMLFIERPKQYGFSNYEAILNENKEQSIDPNMILDEKQSSGNSCSSHGRDYLQTRANFGEIVKKVDNKNIDFKDENFEPSNFEIKETGEPNHGIQQKDNFGENGANFQQNLHEIEQEKQKLETKQDHFDVCEENLESVQLNVSEECKIQDVKMEKYNEAEGFKCEECPKIFPNRTALRKHKRIHSDEMSFTCEICQQTFKYKGSLNRHVREQHYGLGRKSLGKMFDERVGNNNGCSLTVKVNNPESIMNEVCFKDSNFTEETFEQESFDVKERRMDTKEGGNFNDTSKEGNSSLQEMDNETQQQETSVDAKQGILVHERSLEREKNKMHQEQSNFEDQNLDINPLERLENKTFYKCPDCPRTFWNSCDLREHTYKHTDIRSFACKLCGKAFKFRSGLVRHNRKEHRKYGLIQDVVSENKNRGGMEGKDFSEETLQQERGSFESDLGNKEYCKFGEGFERSKPKKRKFSGEKECFKTIVDENTEILERFSNNVNEMPSKSVRQNLPIKKKSSVYNCNKCDATFKEFCDFLAHQRIHK